jgi:hypothetical protein
MPDSGKIHLNLQPVVSACLNILKEGCRTAASRDRCAKAEPKAAIDGAVKASLQMILNCAPAAKKSDASALLLCQTGQNLEFREGSSGCCCFGSSAAAKLAAEKAAAVPKALNSQKAAAIAAQAQAE